jgi:iron-sulfur cluster repair protein YtfE (RIC family)
MNSALDELISWCESNTLYTLRLGKVTREAAAELAQLRAQLEMNKNNLESFMELQAENKKLCNMIAKRYEDYLQKCARVAELESAREEAKQFVECLVAVTDDTVQGTTEWLKKFSPEIRR